MSDPSPFKWRHFEAAIILCAVRWYLRYAPELDRRCRPSLRATNDSYRVDETYIKIKQQWHYLYRAVDSMGATLDFMLSATRDAEAAERFFRTVLQASHTRTPRVITVDKHAAYPLAFEALQQDSTLPGTCLLRQCKYLNNVVEQDHRFVKRQVSLGLGFGGFHTAQRTIQGYEAMHRLRKGQLEGIAKGDVLAQKRVVDQLFGVAASRELTTLFSYSHSFLQHNPEARIRQIRRRLAAGPKLWIRPLPAVGKRNALAAKVSPSERSGRSERSKRS
jgi:IS6 family transposase